MFLDNIDYKTLNKQYLTEAYAKGKLASDYISNIRMQVSLMTYVPGFDKAKINRLNNLIDTYESKLNIAKKELADYKSKSKTEKEKIERLNKIDTIISTGIKIAVVILTLYISFAGAAKFAPTFIAKVEQITKSKKIVKALKFLHLSKLPGFVIDNAKTIGTVTKGVKVAKSAKVGIEQAESGVDIIKIGGYESEIIKCIHEMEELLRVLKNKRDIFERELEKKERGIR